VIESIRHIWHTIAHWTADHPSHPENLAGESPTDEIQENSLESSEGNPSGTKPRANDDSALTASIREPKLAGDSNDIPQKLMEIDVAQERETKQGTEGPRVDDSDSPQWTRIDSFGINDPENTESIVAFPPKTTDQAVDQIVNNQLNIIPLVLLLGFFLMGLIHLPAFRLGCWKAIRWGLLTTYALTIELPRKWLPWNQTGWVSNAPGMEHDGVDAKNHFWGDTNDPPNVFTQFPDEHAAWARHSRMGFRRLWQTLDDASSALVLDRHRVDR
jgi:hypothetical protein